MREIRSIYEDHESAKEQRHREAGGESGCSRAAEGEKISAGTPSAYRLNVQPILPAEVLLLLPQIREYSRRTQAELGRTEG